MCNLSTWETKSERFLIQGHHGLHSKVLFQIQIHAQKFRKSIVFGDCFVCFPAIDKSKVRRTGCSLAHSSVLHTIMTGKSQQNDRYCFSRSSYN